MFMGWVGKPDKSKDVDKRIHLERVSKTVEVKKLTTHQIFCKDVIVNQQIKQGDWMHLHCECATVDHMRQLIQ